MKTLIVSLSFMIILLVGMLPYLLALHKKRIIDKLHLYDEKTQVVEEEENTPRWTFREWIARHLDSRALSADRTRRLADDLYWADIKLRPEEFRLMRLLLSLVFFLVYLLTRDAFLSLLSLVLAMFLPELVVRFRKSRNKKLLNEQIYYSIGVISGSLQAGHSFLQALKIVASDIEDPLRREYLRIVKEINLGLPIQFTLTQAKERIDTNDFSLFVNAVLIQLKTGGNLAEILDRIAATIRDRQKLDNELRTLTAQGRLSGLIIVLLPIALALFMYISNREHIMLLFTTTLGRIMLAMAVGGQIIGIYFIKKIITLDTI